ncbi:MAG: hypothetical protein JF597_49830 [Streptomyces sp.]|uniref:hypothetical protein n=1 Tax=Streptomyces sp. TaxID=1931 RepID=UPI0025EE3E5B|nr:hypothetical protein [Streptomyces sp.]MBW8801367.1 hypothetical protein [Streptomyces sp.]
MKTGCPVGHPSGAGRHCPLCGRAYVPLDQVHRPAVALPAPRHARDDEPAEPYVERDPEFQVEALALLSSLASEFDY